MTCIAVATDQGCRVFDASGEERIELSHRQVGALVREQSGECLAVVDGNEIWRRSPSRAWSQVAVAGFPLQSLACTGTTIFAGGQEEAALLRIREEGTPERLAGFDNVAGRAEWFAGGPPLGVRSLTATADNAVILAAVHVGGIPRSSNGGETWHPTMPVRWDVHEIRSHPTIPNMVAAAAALGLCISVDGGITWTVFGQESRNNFEESSSLAVAVLADEVLFSVQDGPFAKRSQVWRWKLGSTQVEQVFDGMPEWLAGRVDTGNLAAANGRAAILDGGGNLWLSQTGSRGWECIATGLPYSFGVVIL